MQEFKALLLKDEQGKVTSSVTNLNLDQLPAGNVLVSVEYSTLNYKDGLVLNGLGRLVRQYPHVGGIDFAGVVQTSQDDRYKPGDRVILTGWRVGEVHWGGYAQMARVDADWLVPLPANMTTRQAMEIGTAGLTAMLAIMALEEHGLSPDMDGEILVTGAVGGLGSIAVALLAKAGYRVAASTGRKSQHDYLTKLGASTIIDRSELAAEGKPLMPERWIGAIDSVGGATLANVAASLKMRGSVACCGNAGGVTLETTVFPLLLRGINYLGIDSAQCPTPRRIKAWDRLAKEMPFDAFADISEIVGLEDLAHLGLQILRGQVRGRVVVDVNK